MCAATAAASLGMSLAARMHSSCRHVQCTVLRREWEAVCRSCHHPNCHSSCIILPIPQVRSTLLWVHLLVGLRPGNSMHAVQHAGAWTPAPAVCAQLCAALPDTSRCVQQYLLGRVVIKSFSSMHRHALPCTSMSQHASPCISVHQQLQQWPGGF
jgi:hypothetical protein